MTFYRSHFILLLTALFLTAAPAAAAHAEPYGPSGPGVSPDMTAEAEAAEGSAEPGWNRFGNSWYYYSDDRSLLRDADTPDGYHTDANGRFSREADGAAASEAFPEMLREQREEREKQQTEKQRLDQVKADLAAAEEAARKAGSAGTEPGEKGPGVSGPGTAGPEGEEVVPEAVTALRAAVPAYQSIWDRPEYAALRASVAEPAVQYSGVQTGGMPAEFFMLCIAGETSGASWLISDITGDKGRAYGICQLDYRYDLISFLKDAYGRHPALWAGFKPYLGYADGDVRLVENAELRRAFRTAMLTDYKTAVSDQMDFFRKTYWDGLAKALNDAGFHLGERSLAVSAALFSVSVNCGAQPEIYIEHVDANVSDQEFLDAIYRLRNTEFAYQQLENRIKGTVDRYLLYEPMMAVELMYGQIGLDTEKIYGGGVEWYGNPF